MFMSVSSKVVYICENLANTSWDIITANTEQGTVCAIHIELGLYITHLKAFFHTLLHTVGCVDLQCERQPVGVCVLQYGIHITAQRTAKTNKPCTGN